MNKKGIVFGPWVGEFGWELFSWQAHCRAIARSYDFSVVISRPGNSYLYEDFCDLYVPFAPDQSGISDSHMNSAVSNFNVQEFLSATVSHDILTSYDWNWVPPTKIGNPPYDHWRAKVHVENAGDIVPEYCLYRGDSLGEKADILIHARNRKIREIDNWDSKKWDYVVSELKKNYVVACIGQPSSSLALDGTFDVRGKDLRFITGLMRSAKCIVGPSSGPLHLATLSGCPQVWWTSNPNQNYSRYMSTWNPFGIKSIMLNGTNPDPDVVVKAITEI
tara:strand:+ start:2080 stop:2907 length:828 start_codon:yes stop_codon:yes gene_type:complete